MLLLLSVAELFPSAHRSVIVVLLSDITEAWLQVYKESWHS